MSHVACRKKCFVLGKSCVRTRTTEYSILSGLVFLDFPNAVLGAHATWRTATPPVCCARDRDTRTRIPILYALVSDAAEHALVGGVMYRSPYIPRS